MAENTSLLNDDMAVINRFYWLIRVRWIALISALALGFVFSYLEIIDQMTPVISALALLAVFNLLYFFIIKLVNRLRGIGLKLFCLVQILIDILGLLTLIHFTGGLTNPFLFLLVVPVIVGGIFFEPQWTYLLAILTLGLTAALGLLEANGLIPHHSVPYFHEPIEAITLHHRTTMALIALAALLIAGAYLICRVMGALKKKDWLHGQLFRSLEADRRRRTVGVEQRRGALTGLAQGIQSEVKNPLGIIRARVDAMQYSLEDLGERDGLLLEDLEVIAVKVEQIQDTVEKLSAFLSDDTGERMPLEPGEMLQVLVERLASQIAGQGVQLKARIHPGLPGIHGNRIALDHLFYAILENALEGVEGSEKGSISLHARLMRGSLLMVRIRDNGPGIPPDLQRQIFDPFFSTRGQNRGVGLARAYTLVRNHGGEMRIRSRPPPGTSVVVLLPVQPAKGVKVPG